MVKQYVGIAKQIAEELEALRPNIWHQLWQANTLDGVILEAEAHFLERSMHYNNEYQLKFQRPADKKQLLQYAADREAYVAFEVSKEIKNWVNNYPSQDKKRA